MTKVSSTYRVKEGLRGADRMAFSSMCSMTRLAMMGGRDDLIAAPSVCSKNCLWNLKKVEHRQRSARDRICGTVIEVLSGRDWSSFSFSSRIRMAR